MTLKELIKPFYYNLKGKVDYYGFKHFCPICTSQLKYFLPLPFEFEKERIEKGFKFSYKSYETLNIKDYMCPNCSSSDRERLYVLYLKHINFNETQVRVIDFAPSKNFENKFKSIKNVSYQSADLLRKDFDIIIDIENINLKDKSCDLFICSHILEHIKNPKRALCELNRIMSDNGMGIVMVPIIPSVKTSIEIPCDSDDDRWKNHGQGDHLRIFGRNDFINLLKSYFNLQIIDKSHFDKKTLLKYGIDINFKLYIVRKSNI